MGSFLNVQKKGNKYWACCPFHREKTPSFVINPEQQYYHCFGCGKSGSVITFLMENERLSYPEALEWLAKRANMPLPQDESEEDKLRRRQREQALSALKAAARYYFDNLYKPEGRAAIEYINKRELSDATVKEFGIGCSLDFYSLPQYLKRIGYDESTLAYAGIAYQSEGKLLDFLGGRLIIPIINAKGEVIGFGGRSLDNTRMPKYKNTSATPVFDKKRNLYGLNLIKKLQQKEGVKSLILVEGYMDVISLAQAGIKNVIASMGTSLTMEQCAEIKKFTATVYVCYDGDAAGQNATWRSLDMLASAGLEVKVMTMPEDLDPDDTVKKVGKDGFIALMDIALPLIEFKLSKTAAAYNLTTSDGRNKYAQAAVEILSKLDRITQDIYIKTVSELSLLSPDTIRNTIKTATETGVPSEKKETKTEEAEQNEEFKLTPEMRSRIIAARFILSSYINMKTYVDARDIKEEYFDYPPHKKVYDYILSCIAKRRSFVAGDLFDLLIETPSEAQKIIAACDEMTPVKQAEHYAACLAALKKAAVEKRKAEIITLLQTVPDGEEKEALKDELRKLTVKTK